MLCCISRTSCIFQVSACCSVEASFFDISNEDEDKLGDFIWFVPIITWAVISDPDLLHYDHIDSSNLTHAVKDLVEVDLPEEYEVPLSWLFLFLHISHSL